jgi:hypothetical protein
MPEDSVVGCIIRDENPVIPNGNTKIFLHDKLIVLCLPRVQSKVMERITGRIE